MKNLNAITVLSRFGYVKIILLFILIVTTIDSNAQKALDDVEVNLGSGTFVGTKGLPFDVPFRIKSKIAKDYQKVTLQYRIKPSERKNWMHFPSNTQTDKDGWTTPVQWNNLGEEFYMPCGPLHPNVMYEFKFDVIKKTSIADAQKTDLRRTVFKVITTYIDNIKSAEDKDLDELNRNLNTAIQLAVGPGGRVKEPDMKTDFDFDIGDDNIEAFLDAAIIVRQTIDKTTENIAGEKIDYLNSHSNFAVVRDALLHIDVKKFDSKSTQLWDAPINVNATDYKTLKVSELATVIKSQTSNFSKVIGGTLKIDRSGLIITEQPSIGSLEILLDFFYTLNTIQDNTGNRVFPKAEIDILISSLTIVIDQHIQLKQAISNQKTLLDKVPNILEDKYVQFSYIVYDQSTSDVVSESNPYIGLDFGLVVIPSYEQVFIYDGVNFYFAPVNKDAPLSRFNANFWNSLSKRLSVHLGLTHGLLNINKRYEPLIPGVGSVLIGAGLRFNRVCRINYGILTFWEKNKNPLVEMRDLRHMGALSFTIDFNVAKALGNVGKGLGVKN